MSNRPELDYAAPRPIHRRRTFRLWMYALIVVCAIGTTCPWLKPAWGRIQLLYWQHRCLIYTPPADTIAYDSANPNNPVPQDWQRFYSLFSPPGGRSNGTCFIHEIKNPRGQRRLVVIDIFSSQFSSEHYLDWLPFPRVFIPGDLTHSPTQVPSRFDQQGFTAFRSLRIFAATIDPADATHVSVIYEDDGRRGLLDGWLQSDDTIIFAQRKSTR